MINRHPSIMALNMKPLSKSLYHGTGIYCLAKIVADGKLLEGTY